MNTNRMFAVIFALCLELAILIYGSSKIATWLAKTWKWNGNLVLIGCFAVAFGGWFFHVSRVLNKPTKPS